MRIRLALGLALLVGLLAACNLTASPRPTPTRRATATPPTPALTSPPTVPGLPPLLPTPTQALLPPLPQPPAPADPVLVPGPGLPTVDPSAAAGRYPVTLRPGDTVALIYDIAIARGAVTFTVQGAQGLVWQRTFNASESGRHELFSAQGGEFELVVQTQSFDGSYNFRWE
ncbi:MAG: hypothetical protein ACUVSX_09790 [Aggregatilineales bacterium]